MIAIIDYGAGNIAQLTVVLKETTDDFIITKREIDICKSDKIILTRIGEPSFAMRQLNMVNLANLLRIINKPLLGICLGAQLLCEKSEEGDIPCIGVFPLTVTKLKLSNLPVPQKGWNKINLNKHSKLFDGINDGENFYFAHSYYVPVSEFATSNCSYGVEFASSIEKNNFYGVQFYPEKSGEAGVKLLKNFVDFC